jgi:glycosyltransferase involved in cell wall biosynthesis
MESATQIFESLSTSFRWTLMTNRDTPRTERWRRAGAEVIRFSFDENRGAVGRVIQLGQAAVRALGSRADVLHANDIRAAQILLPAASLRRGAYVLTLRDTKAEGDGYGAHWHRVAKRLDALVTLSDDMARQVAARLPVADENLFTIASIVDLDKFIPLDAQRRCTVRASLGLGDQEIAIGIVAGVFSKKRQLEVISRVLPYLEDLPVRLHLIGDFDPDADVYAKSCASAAASAGCESKVVFHGYRDDVAHWLSALDIVLVASEREGLARCMIEAMACGTPVVSMDVCSAREILEPTRAGIVVGMDDWAGMVRVLRDLCNAPSRCAAMGRAGREAAVAKFSGQEVADRWHRLYMRLASQSEGA